MNTIPNVQKYRHFLAILLLLSISFFACEKAPGTGGKATLTGTLYKIKSDGIEIEPNEDVFIIYGNTTIGFDDDTKTNFDGVYKFEYLRKGSYTIYAYSDCDDNNDFEDCIRTIEVEISASDRTITLDSLIVD